MSETSRHKSNYELDGAELIPSGQNRESEERANELSGSLTRTLREQKCQPGLGPTAGKFRWIFRDRVLVSSKERPLQSLECFG